MAKQLNSVSIDLGKGVCITAPFKRNWTVAEWKRMVAHIDGAIGSANPEIERFK